MRGALYGSCDRATSYSCVECIANAEARFSCPQPARPLRQQLHALEQHTFIHELGHAALDARLRELVEIELVDARILVGIVDLPAAFLLADAQRLGLAFALAGEGVAAIAEIHREIARGLGRG